MSELTTFNFENYQIRTVNDDGKILFCGKDVATALGYANPSKAVRDHARADGGLKRYPIVDAMGREQEATFITEGDLYRLIVSSKLPSAQKFETWVFDEVLPTIRKHGAYMTPERIEETLLNPDTIIKLAQNLKTEIQARIAAEHKIEADRPKVLFAESVTASQTSILVAELAKILKANGVDTGGRRLFQWMRENDYLISRKGSERNMPTQKSMNLGLFEIKETAISHADGHISVSKTPKVTGKGQQYFINKFLAAGTKAQNVPGSLLKVRRGTVNGDSVRYGKI